jgi:uncharacterized membrane protein YciS (DUF1049 family)
MTVIAVLLLAVVVVLIVVAVTGSNDSVTVDAFNVSIDTTVAEVFLAGVLTGLLALAALVLLRAGMRRGRQRRQEVRELRRRADTAPAGAETPAASDAATTSADAADAGTNRPATATDRREATPPGDGTDTTTEPSTDRREATPPGDGTDTTTEPHRS